MVFKPSCYNLQNIKLATFDIETDYPDNPKDVLLIGFYDGESYREFNNFNNFLNFTLRKRYYNYNIYAHNGGRFDFKFLLDDLSKFDYDFNIVDVNGNILQIEIPMVYYYNDSGVKLPKYTIKFRDSYMLMKDSLHKLSYSFNVPHKKIECNFFNKNTKENLSPPNNLPYEDKFENWDKFCEYLEYDTIGLYECIRYFENVLHSFGGNIKLTIASTALSLFKNNYLHSWIYPVNKQIKIGHLLGKDIFINIEDEIRKYYIGGRTEIDKRYGEYLFYYDINSLYPFVMQSNEFPVSSPLFVLPEQLSKNDKGFLMCDIYYDENKCKSGLPFLPVKLFNKNFNKLIYPTGKWSGLYDIDVINFAKDLGYEVDIKYGFIFDYEPIFKDFINDMYSLRKENDSYNIIFKYIMNSSYGKFAQKRLTTQIVKMTDSDEFKDCKIEPYIDDLGLYKIEKEISSNHIIPSISYRVTQLAQMELYKWYKKADYDIYMSDTDSFITTKQLTQSKNLGDIKLEYEIDRGIFLFPKFYCFEGYETKTGNKITIKRMKGFSKGIEDINYQDFHNALFNNDFKKFNIKFNDLWGFKESLKRKNTFLTWDTKSKSIQSQYDKRILYEDGINTKPLSIENNLIVR